jgi:filamentous hemagglutinin family protein
MEKVRKISKRYYFRQIAACWLVSCMLFALPVQIAMAIENPAADALPSGHSVAAGSVGQFDYGTTNQLHLKEVANGTIINWTNFDIGSEAWTEFQQNGGAASAVLNRVSGDVTGIMGTLTANGRVFIVNPAGVIFGSGASVNVAQLVASSLDIANGDFIAGNYEFLVGDGVGEVINDGTINAQGVALLGQRVVNTGTITTTNPDGFVVMAAGDRIVLGEPGSSVVVEMSSATGSIDGVGEVINEGTISSPGGTVVLAAGDIFSAALGDDAKAAKVDGGSGTVQQNGTISASAATGDGGTVSLTSGDVTVLGSTSQTTANAGTNGNGGQVVVYSPGNAIFEDGARVEAKGGSQSGDGGFFELSGKQYVQIEGDIDLTATNGESGMFLIDPLDLWIVDDVTVDVSEGPTDTWKPTGDTTVSQLDVDDLEGYLDLANVTLSTLDTPDADGQDGDIIFNFATNGHDLLTSGASGESNNSLIVKADHNIEFYEGSNIRFEGDGDVKLYASTKGDSPDYDGGVIAPATGKNPRNIWTNKGDIIIEAGSGGINMGVLQTGTETTSGEVAEIRLSTINGNGVTIDYANEENTDFDITVQHLDAEGKRMGSVYVESAGDLTMNGSSSLGGAVHAKTNTTSIAGDPHASSFICLIADGDVDITGLVYAEAKSDSETVAGVWIGAGTNVEEPSGGYSGSVYVDGNIQADAKGDGTKQDAMIRVYGSSITLGSKTESVAKDTQYKYQDEGISGYNDDGATYVIDPEEPDSDGLSPLYDKLVSGTRALVDIDILKDGSCLNCANKQIQIVFLLEDDLEFANWRTGYTIDSIDFPALSLDVLANDDPVIAESTTTIITIIDSQQGTLIPGGSESYPTYEYIPPSYDEDFVWDGSSQYATFEDTFTYQVEITTEDGTFLSENTALVTITVRNEVPTLTGASDSIHMNTSADFSLSDLVTDNDGTPGELTVPENFVGTYGDLTYGIVEGTIPVIGGSIPTGDTLTMPTDETITYTPLEGYVSPPDTPYEPTTFGYSVVDSSIVDEQETPVEQSGALEVTVTNELPSGDGWLGTTEMDTSKSTGFIEGGFADNDDDDVSILGSPFDGAEYLTGDPTSDYGGDLTYDGDNSESKPQWTYTPDTDNLPGYTGDENDDWNVGGYQADEQFTVDLWDGQNEYQLAGSTPPEAGDGEEWTAVGPAGEGTLWVRPVYGEGTVSVDLTNDLPEGDSWLGTTQMDTALNNDSLDTDGFSSDVIDIEIVGASSDDYNGSFGGSLTYDGTDYDYDPTAMGLPGYVGDDVDDFDDGGYVISDNADDRFDVKLWDGEYLYTFDGQGGYERTKQYGEGTISVDITNELPGGDAWFGQVHMDSQDVTQYLEVDFGAGIDVDADTYTGSVIGSGLYGGTLEYDDDTWTYSTDTDLPGYIGDDNDDYGQLGYVADDLFTVNLSSDLGQQYDYWFEEGPPPDGYEFYAPSEIFRKAVFSEGTVSVDITNALPTIDEETTIEHMNEDIINQLFAEDQLDGNPINELDDLTITDNSYPGFGSLTLIDNGDGTYSYTYEPAEGYVGNDSFDVTVWDGQKTYTFDSEDKIKTVTEVYVEGTVSMQFTNIKPSAEGNLGEVAPADPPIPQDGVTSPVLVTDPLDAPQQNILDNLSIVPGVYVSSSGSTLEFKFTGSEWIWIYTPAPDAPGEETFTINVWDGQYIYFNIEEREPVFGEGTVIVSTTPEGIIPPAPLVRELIEYSGCPVLLQAAATELGTTTETIQISIAQALATAPNIHPCDACANLVNYAVVLRDTEGAYLQALAQVVNEFAASDAPPSEEEMASIADAIARHTDDGTHYAAAGQYLDALAQYVGLLNENFGYPMVDSVAFAADKYVGPLAEKTDNVAVSTYVASRLGEIAGQ